MGLLGERIQEEEVKSGEISVSVGRELSEAKVYNLEVRINL